METGLGREQTRKHLGLSEIVFDRRMRWIIAFGSGWGKKRGMWKGGARIWLSVIFG